ncbi:MAG: RsmE family RNA methyltransferase [Oscillospiraceae bacterium]|nr:RsmE family RNA methyltransferase [Oscillospiraceae bacterium]
MTRFFLPPDALGGNFAVLTGENASHAKVLRLKTGDRVILCDGASTDCTGVISDVSPGQLGVVIEKRIVSPAEPVLSCTVYMAYAKQDKFEHVVQKATELGAMELVAFPSARCVSRPDEKSIAKKLERWQKIAASAAEQSGRGRIPSVTTAQSYAAALARAAQADFPLFFYENEQTRTLHDALGAAVRGTVSLMTGPEGGFEPSEADAALAAGMAVCSLGPRILRCETAPLCALTAVMYAGGQL